MNGQCRPSDGNFTKGSWFSWIAVADFNGTRTVNGVACNEWLFARGGVPIVAACATDTTIVEFSVFSVSRAVNIIFSNVTAAVPNPVVAPPECTQVHRRDCVHRVYISRDLSQAPPTCPQSPWQQMRFYRLHSWYDQAVGQRNFADITGDFAYICPGEWARVMCACLNARRTTHSIVSKRHSTCQQRHCCVRV
jgi:hypothetical protein